MNFISWMTMLLITPPLINGGQTVKSNDAIFHSTVMIEMDSFGSCSGTLIAADLILTAAHCVEMKPSQITILFSGKSSDTVLGADDYQAHESYDSAHDSEVDNFDMALVYFKDGLPEGYKTVPILDVNAKIDGNSSLTVAGFGKGSPAGQLAKISLKVMDFPESKTQIKLAQTSTHGACFGDSGGPAYFTDQEGKIFVTGVASYVDKPDCDGFVVYTKPQAYAAWIVKTAAELRAKHENP